MIHFMRPEWFYLFIALPFLIYGLKQTVVQWRRWIDADLLPHLLLSSHHSYLLFWFVLAYSLAVLALAGPSWQKKTVPLLHDQSALVIALDLSRSMLAEDIKPSRLKRAKFKIRDILKQRKEGQTALIVFAGAAFTVVPLTEDHRTILAQLPALQPDIMPAQGSLTSKAIELATRLLTQSEQKKGQIILLTDGGDLSASIQAAQNAAKQHYTVSVLGIGTKKGAPIPTDEGWLKEKGQTVIAKLDPIALQTLAKAGQGQMTFIQPGDQDIQSLLKSPPLDQFSKKMTAEYWVDQGYWLLWILLPLAVLAFRRGILIFILFGHLPSPAQANESSLWWRPDQQAQHLMAQKKYQQAAEYFQNQDWKAVALYRAGKYQQAAQIWAQQNSAQADYNRGNALAQMRQFEQAIQAYQSALQKKPDFKAAQHNLELLQKMQSKHSSQPKKSTKQTHADPAKQDQNRSNAEPHQRSHASNKQSSSRAPKNQNRSNNKNQTNAEQSQQGTNKTQTDTEQAQQKKGIKDQTSAEQAEQKKETNKDQTGTDQAEQKEGMADQNKPVQQNQDRQKAMRQAQSDLKSEPSHPFNEQELARDRLLNRIPDDPSALWRIKFQYQYQSQYHEPIQHAW